MSQATALLPEPQPLPMKRSPKDEEEHKIIEVPHPLFLGTRNTYNPKSGLSAHMTTYSNVGHRGGLGGIK